MHYLIDGYNFLFWRSYGSQAQFTQQVTPQSTSRANSPSKLVGNSLSDLKSYPRPAAEPRFQARALGRSQPDPKAHSVDRYPDRSPKASSSDTLQRGRKELIDELSALVEPYVEMKNRGKKSQSGDTALRVRLIFDSPSSPGDAGYDRYCPIEVIYTPRNLSADEFILEIIQAQIIRKELTVITQDQRLRRQIEALGCHVLDFDTFLERLQRGISRANCRRPQSQAMRDRWVQHYCELFEERYRNRDELDR